ncbi:cytochrome C [Luteibacter sp. PPL201]|uniref:Cytochrome C n=1 Tax=Luteibacter sahnii TaxID=3021977 RepID=A0ABT6BBZ0_9GAMM|nr:cytochrome C [Luteibacter sp. PPL193]MDY1547398.1 cytochrome C [Luteibacter sp. PPL193]
MRALLLILLGLVIGAMGATFALSALRQGVPFHKAVMAVMAHHAGELHAQMRAGTCEAKGIAARLARLRGDAGDVREAFGDGIDAGFGPAADQLTTALDRAIAAAPASCAALSTVMRPVDDACQSCHRRYR